MMTDDTAIYWALTVPGTMMGAENKAAKDINPVLHLMEPGMTDNKQTNQYLVEK